MQRYRLPGYEMQLLGELQRQQNSTQFCDTLLQTEGISVPTHSCVLAALSPYLSQKLSAIPSPPSGQKRRLQLQAVKPQILLKLIGLLYSGELEVKGSVEQNDVLAAARQFGMADLVEGHKDLQERWQSLGRCSKYCIHAEEVGQRAESRKMQDAQVQAEMAQRRDTDSSAEKRSCVSTGTQTVNAGEKAVGSSLTLSNQTKPPTPEPAPSVVQNLDFSILLQSQNITLEKHLCSTSSPLIPRMLNGAPTDGESTSYQSSDSITNPTPISQVSNNLTFPVSLNDASNSPTPEEDSTYQQPSEFVDSIQVLAEELAGLEDGQTNDQMSEKRDEGEVMLGEEKGKSTEKRCANANTGMKSLTNMKQLQQMMETTQISIKVKLRRRRPNGEMWEVVSMQDTDETLSVVTSLMQDGSNHKRPQRELTNIQPPPCITHRCALQKPETQIPQPATTNSPKPPPHPNTSSESQPLSSDYVTPNHNEELLSAPLPQPRGPVEESDEQIEKLLEDIMMGLNILPNMEKDCKKSHNPPTHNGAICQVPVAENEAGQIHAAITAEDCVCYQDLRTKSGHSSTDTGVCCCFTAQNQPSCTSLSPVPPDALLIQQQQQQRSPQHHSSAYMGQTDGMLLSKSQNSLYPEALTTSSVIASALYSTGQEPRYPASQVASSQEEQNILEFLPVSNGNETLSLHSFCLSCMDDLRLPPCLSPLEANTSAANQPVLNISINHGNNTEQQSSRHGRPWLTENPGSLQFPLSAIAERENKCTSLKQDTNHAHWLMQCPEHLQFNQQHGRTCAEPGADNKVGERKTVSAGIENAAELKSDLRRTKKSLKCKQCDAKVDSVTPKRRKRKCPSDPQDAVGSLLTYPNLKVSDGTKNQINLSVCSVSLSSNNVLANEREVAISSSNKPSKFGGKPNQQSTITEKLKEKTRGPEECTKLVNTDQTRIRTRGFLRKAQETPSNKSTESSPVPVICRATIVTKQVSLFGPKRERRKKTKLEDLTHPDSVPPIIEKKSHNGENEQQTEKDLPKESLENSEKTKTECKKRKRNRSAEVVLIPLKKTISAESTAEAENNNDKIPAVRKVGTPKQMVSLKEFQKLIKRQHSKTRKSKENHKTNETVRNTEDKMEACDNTASNCEEESRKETEMDIDVIHPESTGEIEESHVIFNVTVDKNHNQISKKSTAENHRSQEDDTNSAAGRETSLFGEECHPVFPFDVCEEEVAKLAAEGGAESKQPLNNQDQALPCSTGVSDIMQAATNDDGSSDSQLPREDKKPLDHNLNPQTPERTGPSLSGGFSWNSGCNQEEEEVEVDVLLYSPDKVPQTRECEDGLDNMALTPDEEEEEDVNEIDVTGDEAE
ncbi:uncharacterized protein LOC122979161 isoform X1 [Thunnus albacares]|uniref:uncharacterized protein LOC122979161 isoform X1 n=1 Tax=Thunnus albacares TaxID=8236 RepID=UPI001CF67472|nr:uncharacterized protein LOC122979161 isoform X1 [Thunnus albacares]XP_044202325.1 uncharacterized protein LOC122979161 isoform X1 [Thunnus albacares]